MNINELIRISKQSNFIDNEFCVSNNAQCERRVTHLKQNLNFLQSIPTYLPEVNRIFGSANKNRYKTILPSKYIYLFFKNNEG